MPCTDGREKADEAASERRIDFVTALLCDLCNRLKGVGIPKPQADWYEIHQQLDAIRSKKWEVSTWEAEGALVTKIQIQADAFSSTGEL